MQASLFLHRGVHVPQNIIVKALNSIPSYVMHLKPTRRFERAHFFLTDFGEHVQADVGFLFPDDGYSYFLLVIDW
jgi:hypothetical protein